MVFFILSDVLLYNWQINQVEEEYLKKNERPERHGKHYYYSIMENIKYPKGNFGIYGNQYRSLNDSMVLIIYGNNRNITNFKIQKDQSLLDSSIKNAPRITKYDYSIFERMAGDYTPDLIKILIENTYYIKDITTVRLRKYSVKKNRLNEKF